MRIREISELSGVPIEAIRDYERTGLLPPPARGDNDYRRYGDAELEGLLSPRDDCAPVDALVAKHLGNVRERIEALRRLERQLAELQHGCGDRGSAAASCGSLSATERPVREPGCAAASHRR